MSRDVKPGVEVGVRLLEVEVEVSVSTAGSVGEGSEEAVEEAAKTMPFEETACLACSGAWVGSGVGAGWLRSGSMMKRFALLLVVAELPLKSTRSFSLTQERLLKEKRERIVDELRGTPKRDCALLKAGISDRPRVAFLYSVEPSFTDVVVHSAGDPSASQ